MGTACRGLRVFSRPDFRLHFHRSGAYDEFPWAVGLDEYLGVVHGAYASLGAAGVVGVGGGESVKASLCLPNRPHLNGLALVILEDQPLAALPLRPI